MLKTVDYKIGCGLNGFWLKKFLLPQNQNIWEETTTKIEARKPWHGILSLILCTKIVPLHRPIQFLISCLYLIVDSALELKKLNIVINKQLKWWIINTKHPTHNSMLFSSSKLLRTYTTHSVKKSHLFYESKQNIRKCGARIEQRSKSSY